MSIKLKRRFPGAERLDRKSLSDVADRIWRKDASLWSRTPEVQQAILNRLGWLDAVDVDPTDIARLRRFAEQVLKDGFTHVVLLGMGGSSLAPEVLSKTFPDAPNRLELTVLDSTAPDTIRAVDQRTPKKRTLFVVSSKSGTTTETLSLFEYFFHRLRTETANPGRQFVAVSDAGTPLSRLAQERGFRDIFHAPADIGGRYSALSFFGLVPAALMDVDLEALTAAAAEAAERTQSTAGLDGFLALELGVMLADFARRGRDKLVLMLSPGLAPLGAWIEQLVAESTGKDGCGIIPVLHASGSGSRCDGEVIVSVVAEDEMGDLDPELKQFVERGVPIMQWSLGHMFDLGGEFFRWEFATAVAAYRLGINPFDEPDVAESKKATAAALDKSTQRTDKPTHARLYDDDVLQWFGDEKYLSSEGGAVEALRRLAGEVRPCDYVTILAYLPPFPQIVTSLERLRRRLEARLGVVTCLAFGPRYLHSSGQLHKGGPNTGVYIQITAEPHQDLAVPGEEYTFQRLITAQAAGDFDVLRRRGRRILRAHLKRDVDAGLSALDRLLAEFVIENTSTGPDIPG